MKHLKTFNIFENINSTELAEEIAADLLPIMKNMRRKGQKITTTFFETFMQERGADDETIDQVMNILVDNGFNFEMPSDDEEVMENVVASMGNKHDPIRMQKIEKLKELLELAADTERRRTTYLDLTFDEERQDYFFELEEDGETVMYFLSDYI
jgi:hypothetical protein